MAELADYLGLTAGQAREQFRVLAARRPVQGGRQVTFIPVETLLCLAASFLVNHRHYGGSTADKAAEPVPSLARLFSRPPSSVLAKMANLAEATTRDPLARQSSALSSDITGGEGLRPDRQRHRAARRVAQPLLKGPATGVAFRTTGGLCSRPFLVLLLVN